MDTACANHSRPRWAPDKVSVTVGYVGDLFQPNEFARFTAWGTKIISNCFSETDSQKRKCFRGIFLIQGIRFERSAIRWKNVHAYLFDEIEAEQVVRAYRQWCFRLVRHPLAEAGPERPLRSRLLLQLCAHATLSEWKGADVGERRQLRVGKTGRPDIQVHSIQAIRIHPVRLGSIGQTRQGRDTADRSRCGTNSPACLIRPCANQVCAEVRSPDRASVFVSWALQRHPLGRSLRCCMLLIQCGDQPCHHPVDAPRR